MLNWNRQLGHLRKKVNKGKYMKQIEKWNMNTKMFRETTSQALEARRIKLKEILKREIITNAHRLNKWNKMAKSVKRIDFTSI